MIVGLERKRSGGSFTHFDSTVITTDTGTASSTSFGNIDAGYIYRGYVNECFEDVIEVECFESTSGTITIPHPPDPTPEPSPTIDILNLASPIQEGDSDSFSVRAMDVESKVAYTIQASTDNGDIGFESPCPSNGDESVSGTLSGAYSYTVTFTLEACDTTGGTVTATLRQGTNDVVSTTQRVTVTSRPNRPPTFDDGTSTTRSIEENVVAGTGVFPAVEADDPDDDTLTYSLSGADRSSFSIVSNSGLIRTRASLNYEAKSSYSVDVEASDGEDDDTITVTINVINLDEPGQVSFLSASAPEVGKAFIATLYDPDGGVEGEDWQWQESSNGSSWDDISGAEQSFYSPEPSDGGKYLRATVFYRDAHGPRKKSTSAASSRVRPAPPTNISVDMHSVDPNTIVVSYQLGGPPHYYQFELHRSSTETGDYTEVATKGKVLSPVEFDGVASEYWYKARGRNCVTSDPWTECGTWTSLSSAFFLQTKLGTPQPIVEPIVLRRALLYWQPVANSDHNTRYTVSVRDGSSFSVLPDGTDIAENYYEIDLDDIWSGNGLAQQPSGFDFMVKATDQGGAVLPSNDSKTVRVIDNPLLHDGGRAHADGSGRAALRWTTDSRGSNYIIRYRQLGFGTSFGIGAIDHTNINWPKYSGWPYYHGATDEPSDSSSSHNIQGLDDDEIYAIQINYEIEDIKVFSARDAFVWPSSELPGNNKRVATYPFFGHHAGRTFEYIICHTTFPLSERATWVDIIVDAFEQWEEATDGFITMTRDLTGGCPFAAVGTDPTRRFIVQDDRQNEVRMFNVTSMTAIHAFPEFKSDAFKNCLRPGTSACVTSFHGYSGLSTQDPEERRAIAEHVASQNWRALLDILGALLSDRQASNAIQSVDVSFNQARFKSIADPSGLSDLNIPANVAFNTCMPDTTPASLGDDPDEGYKAYMIAVHEAGHALGLSGFSFRDLLSSFVPDFIAPLLNRPIIWFEGTDGQRYVTSHPTIPDSVLNYDDDDKIRSPIDATFAEPDCSPHPFDIVAIYALYQTK